VCAPISSHGTLTKLIVATHGARLVRFLRVVCHLLLQRICVHSVRQIGFTVRGLMIAVAGLMTSSAVPAIHTGHKR
jgi:hypothetical protein